MKCENKVGKEFDSLAKRLVYSYMASYSKFISANINNVTDEVQKQTHDFLGSLLCKIYENPAVIGLPLEKDDFFDREAFKDRPELAKKMKNLEKKFLDFFDFLFEIGDIGELKDTKLYVSNTKIKLQKSKITSLEQIGLKSETVSDGIILYSEEYPELFIGLKCLVNICKTTYGRDTKNPAQGCSLRCLMFIHCIFDEKHISWTNLYGDLLQSGIYIKELEEYFISKGYQNDYHDSIFKLQKAYPNKQSGSFAVMFAWRRKNQLCYAVDIPSLRVLMEHFDEMDDELKELVFSRTKTCDTCGYCTQTGKREIVAVQLKYIGESLNKCPYYPNFSWDSLDEETVSAIKKLCDFAEDILCIV